MEGNFAEIVFIWWKKYDDSNIESKMKLEV